MPKKKRQFKGTSTVHRSYDRKVIHSRTGRTLSLTKIIPKDWLYVRIQVNYRQSDLVSLNIMKLMGVEEAAQITSTNKTNKPHTP